MEIKNCSNTKHLEIEATSYCQECNFYMCNKCSNLHSELFELHHSINIKNDTKEIFTGYCNEKKHNIELEFYCKTHNQLCCAACLCKINNKGKGQHNRCEVCNIEDIKNKKKKLLKDNIDSLNDLSKNIEKSIEELKKIFEKINEKKESLKLQIQKIFTKIRNAINDREDELLFEVDATFDELFFREEFIKQSEKLPKKIKESLETSKIIVNEWNNDNKLSSLI